MSCKCTCWGGGGVRPSPPPPPITHSPEMYFPAGTPAISLDSGEEVQLPRTQKGVTGCPSAQFQELTCCFLSELYKFFIRGKTKTKLPQPATNQSSKSPYHVTLNRIPDTHTITICFFNAVNLEVLYRTGMIDHCS